MAATSRFPALAPLRSVDLERRRARSHDPEVALGMLLDHVVAKHDLELLVVTDTDGAPVASSGDEEAALDLADFASRVAHDHLLDLDDPSGAGGGAHWQSMVTSRGYVIIERIDVGFRRFCVAAQSRFALPDRTALARAVAAAMRILSNGIAVDTPAPLPLVTFGSWGDWDGFGDHVVDGED